MLFTHATASRIKSYKQCEFKYFLEYMLQFPPLRAGNIYSEKGSAVHLALEKYAHAVRGNVDGLPEEKFAELAEIDYEKTLREYYIESGLWKMDIRKPDKGGFPHPAAKTCESCPWATKDQRCELADKAIDAVEGCPRPNFQQDLDLIEKTLTRTDYNPLKTTHGGMGQVCFERKILGIEYAFKMELGGVPVKGVIDLVAEEDEETLEIIDYKTGRAMSYDKAFNDPQVRTYGAVARLIWPQYKYIMVTLHYLKTNPVTVPLGPSDDELTVKSLQRAMRQISQNANPRRQKGWLCPYCVEYENCGKIRDKFKVDGRFRLPTITCEMAGHETPCWGNMYPLKDETYTIDTVDKMKYYCAGHGEMPGGGEYIKNPNDSD